MAQEYSSSIIRIAVSQICQSIGFHASQTSALNTLTDIATRFLQSIARSASSSANSFNRTHSNAFDIIMALEELGTVQGFTGCSQTNVECVMASSLVVQLERFLVFSDETPFAKPLPRRRIGDDYYVSMLKKDGVVKMNHVPRWLPVMPAVSREEEEVEEGEGGKWEEGWKCCDEEREEVDRERIESSGKRGGGVKKGGRVARSGGGKKRVLCQNDWESGKQGVEKKRVMVSFNNNISQCHKLPHKRGKGGCFRIDSTFKKILK